MPKYIFAAMALTALASALTATSAQAGDGAIEKAENPIPGQYIVVLKEPASGTASMAGLSAAQSLFSKYRAQIRSVYDSAITGFAIEASEADAQEIASHPAVDFVEENGIVTLAATQANAPWGLDRIDQSSLPLSTSYSYNKSGRGVHVYVADTGVRVSHTEFGGRARNAYDVFGGRGHDDHGHGTHVAATIGGRTTGVAKKATIHSVKVIDGRGAGSIDGIVRAVNWITKNRQNPAVVNMSLGGGTSSAMDRAIRNSIASGVVYVIAAGNNNRDASTSSPARISEAITVAASTANDSKAAFSNYGSVVDLFAPGEHIHSAHNGNDNDYTTMSGTSMAAPHVAGVAALILQASPQLTPIDVQRTLIGRSTPNAIARPGRGTPSRLLRADLTPVLF